MVSNVQLSNAIESLRQTVSDSITDNKRSNDMLLEKIELISTRIGVIEGKVETVADELYAVSNKVNENQTNNDNIIEELKGRINTLETKLTNMENLSEKFNDLRELTEERTNRQLRETLIFKNVPEQAEETWNDTKILLAKLISEHCDMRYEDVIVDIKRAHRERKRPPNADNTRTGKRHIYVAFKSWDLPQNIIEVFRQKNINDRNFVIHAEQKYGPMTSKRRNLALQKRKELKGIGAITSGYIDFPARLMVNVNNTVNREGKKLYICHTDFSRHVLEE